MRTISESINEARSTSSDKVYLIKFVSGKYKGRYLGGDDAMWRPADFVVTDMPDIDPYLLFFKSEADARDTMDSFNEWNRTRNLVDWGDSVVTELTLVQKEI